MGIIKLIDRILSEWVKQRRKFKFIQSRKDQVKSSWLGNGKSVSLPDVVYRTLDLRI